MALTQVLLEQAFFRRLVHRLEDERVEPLEFGISGWRTLHAHLAYEALAPCYGLDVVGYVFVKNDPGDNLYSIQSRRGVRFLPRPFSERAGAPLASAFAW